MENEEKEGCGEWDKFTVHMVTCITGAAVVITSLKRLKLWYREICFRLKASPMYILYSCVTVCDSVTKRSRSGRSENFGNHIRDYPIHLPVAIDCPASD